LGSLEISSQGIEPDYAFSTHKPHTQCSTDSSVHPYKLTSRMELHGTSSILILLLSCLQTCMTYRSADKSLAQSGRKQATATHDFDFGISYL